jgi:hypothetical protein
MLLFSRRLAERQHCEKLMTSRPHVIAAGYDISFKRLSGVNPSSMIRKSAKRFSEKIMVNQEARAPRS